LDSTGYGTSISDSRSGWLLHPRSDTKVVAIPRVGGLHHRYEWLEAA
jgi:hypothetical protein